MRDPKGYEYGARRIEHSLSKISGALYSWDYAKYGRPTPEKLAKIIPMGIDTVKRHYNNFTLLVHEINLNEKIRLEALENERIKAALASSKK
jgi:hypothetical protein